MHYAFFNAFHKVMKSKDDSTSVPAVSDETPSDKSGFFFYPFVNNNLNVEEDAAQSSILLEQNTSSTSFGTEGDPPPPLRTSFHQLHSSCRWSRLFRS